MAVPVLADLEHVTTNNLLNKRRGSKVDCCVHCEESFKEGENKIVFNCSQWHKKCFLCAQCLRELDIDRVFQIENRLYCKHDYKMLFAPSCYKCNKFILKGKVIKALEHSWHSKCFVCSICMMTLAENQTFKKIDHNPYCQNCYNKKKSESVGKYICHKCKGAIEHQHYLKLEGELYHPYHFKCTTCRNELDKNFREKDGSHYCLRCFDRIGIPICSACKRPVEDRVVYALGKTYHVEHFVCSFCNKPFLGSRYFVHNKDIFCDTHYQMVVRNICTYCNKEVGQNSVEFLSKFYCLDHFQCFACDLILNKDSTIYKVDRKPICKHCLLKLPGHLRKRLTVLHRGDR